MMTYDIPVHANPEIPRRRKMTCLPVRVRQLSTTPGTRGALNGRYPEPEKFSLL
jgi:hypothetical protein